MSKVKYYCFTNNWHHIFQKTVKKYVPKKNSLLLKIIELKYTVAFSNTHRIFIIYFYMRKQHTIFLPLCHQKHLSTRMH